MTEPWVKHPSREGIVNELENLRTSIDTALAAPDADTAGVYIEIAVTHLLAARTFAWDHYTPAERKALLAELDFCGIPHPLLRQLDVLEV